MKRVRALCLEIGRSDAGITRVSSKFPVNYIIEKPLKASVKAIAGLFARKYRAAASPAFDLVWIRNPGSSPARAALAASLATKAGIPVLFSGTSAEGLEGLASFVLESEALDCLGDFAEDFLAGHARARYATRGHCSLEGLEAEGKAIGLSHRIRHWRKRVGALFVSGAIRPRRLAVQ